MNYIPLLTTIIAFTFSALLLKQFIQRRRIHQLLWTVAMIFYGITALMEFLMNPELYGLDPIIFKIYYILAAPLVGLLGAGVVYLLAKRRTANISLLCVIILSAFLIILGIFTPLDESQLKETENLAIDLRNAVQAYPLSVRIFSILLNSIWGMILIIGALYSFIDDRTRTYNIFLFLGALMPMIGGFFFGILGDPSIFFEFELAGTVFLFIGFVMSDRYVRTVGKKEEAEV